MNISLWIVQIFFVAILRSALSGKLATQSQPGDVPGVVY